MRRRARLGISPFIATLILVMVTIAVGAILGVLFMSSAGGDLGVVLEGVASAVASPNGDRLHIEIRLTNRGSYDVRLCPSYWGYTSWSFNVDNRYTSVAPKGAFYQNSVQHFTFIGSSANIKNYYPATWQCSGMFIKPGDTKVITVYAITSWATKGKQIDVFIFYRPEGIGSEPQRLDITGIEIR